MKRFFMAALCALAVLAGALPTDIPHRACAYERVNGKVVNVAIAVRFSDSSYSLSSSDGKVLREVFSEGDDSLSSFISVNSAGRAKVETAALYETFVAEIDRPSSRYMPAYTFYEHSGTYRLTNPDGYDNRTFDRSGKVSSDGSGLISVDYVVREQEFVRLVLAAAEQKLGSYADGDGDGYVDSVTVIPLPPVRFNEYSEKMWATVFWPHMSNLYAGSLDSLSRSYYVPEGYSDLIDEGEIFSSRAYSGVFVSEYMIVPLAAMKDGRSAASSVICHEFMHVLGAPDYYPYDSDEVYVGEYDVMCSNAEPPQLSLSYLRCKMGWLDEGSDVLAADRPGDYVLYPAESNPAVKAYKLVLGDYFSTGDVYYIEYRDKSYPLGAGLTDSGLIIYRVNEELGYVGPDGNYTRSALGNMYGAPEVYVFRRWENVGGFFSPRYVPRKELTKNGINYAVIPPDKDGYTSYGSADGKKDLVTSSDGKNTGISVTALRFTDDGGIEFSLDFPYEENDLPFGEMAEGGGVRSDRGGNAYLLFDASTDCSYAYVLVTDDLVAGVTAEGIASGKYGEVKRVPASFRRCDLPTYSAGDKVYVCFGDGEKFGKVYLFSSGSSPKDLLRMLAVPVAIGVAAVAVFIAAGTIIAKKIRKKEK